MARCNKCGGDIVFVPTGGTKPDGSPVFRPVSPDGTPHVCRGEGAPTSTAAPKVEEGVLISVAGNGVIVSTSKGDRTFAIHAALREVALPAKIKYIVKDRGFIEVPEMIPATPLPPKEPEEFRTAKEVNEDADRLNGPADGECVTEPLIRPPAAGAKENLNHLTGPPITPANSAPAQQPTPPGRPAWVPPATATVKESLTLPPVCGESCTYTTPHTPAGVRMWSGDTRLTIGVTVNLENYENLRIEVSGAAADREALIEYLDETLGKFGSKSEITKSKIEAYRRRVIG